MFDQRHAPRHPAVSPIRFRLAGREAEGTLVNLSGTGALFRFDSSLPFGPETVGQTVVFLAWLDVGALLKSPAVVIRYAEETDGKLLAVRYLPEDPSP